MRIATYINAEGDVASFYEKGHICIFEDVDQTWNLLLEVPLSLHPGMMLSETKAIFTDAISRVGAADAFIVAELRGILRVFLEERGLRVWKSAGPLADQLDSVSMRHQERAEAELQAAREAALGDPFAPKPVDDPSAGRFRINLIELMDGPTPRISRDVLVPFLETVSFQQLEIICDHVPRWLPGELPSLGLRLESNETSGSEGPIRVLITPAQGSWSVPGGPRSVRSSCHCGG